jgi:NAD(P)-dependent dehydrogenase (short-subunit alcohol dehydrogenase family)
VNVDAAQTTVDPVVGEGGTMQSLQPCDLTSAAGCQNLVEFAISAFRRIDVLFNNAAIAHFNWLEDITDEECDRGRRDEVDLIFYLTRGAWPHLKASRGVVVNMASLNTTLSSNHCPHSGTRRRRRASPA